MVMYCHLKEVQHYSKGTALKTPFHLTHFTGCKEVYLPLQLFGSVLIFLRSCSGCSLFFNAWLWSLSWSGSKCFLSPWQSSVRAVSRLFNCVLSIRVPLLLNLYYPICSDCAGFVALIAGLWFFMCWQSSASTVREILLGLLIILPASMSDGWLWTLIGWATRSTCNTEGVSYQ